MVDSVGDGVVGVVALCDGLVGLGDGLVAVLLGAAGLGLAVAGCLAGDDVCAPGDGWSGEDTDHGGAGALAVADGCVVGNQVVVGVDRFRAGTPGRWPDREAPEVRATVGGCDAVLPNDEVVPGGACVVADSRAPNGTKNTAPATATTPVVSPVTFTTGNRRRLCRGPEVLV